MNFTDLKNLLLKIYPCQNIDKLIGIFTMKLSIIKNVLIPASLGLIISTNVFGQRLDRTNVTRLECIVTSRETSDKENTKYPKSKIFVTIERGSVGVDGDSNYTFSFYDKSTYSKTEDLSDSKKFHFNSVENDVFARQSLTIDRVTGYLNYSIVIQRSKSGRWEKTITGECNSIKNLNKF